MHFQVNKIICFIGLLLLFSFKLSAQIDKRDIKRKLKELNEFILSLPGGPNLSSKAMINEHFVDEDILISDFFSDSLGLINSAENIFNHLMVFDTFEVKLELVEICRELTVNKKKIIPCVIKQITKSYLNGALSTTRNDTLILVYNYALSQKDLKEKKNDNVKIFSIVKSNDGCEKITDEKLWEYSSQKNNRKAYRDYIKSFPDGKHIVEAREKRKLDLDFLGLTGGRWKSQRHSVYVGAGGTLYNGDLSSNFKTIRPTIQVSYNFRLFERVTIRSALSYVRLYGDDSYGRNTKTRNLRFNCNLLEPSLIWEYFFIKRNLNPRYSFTSLHSMRFFSASISLGLGFSYYSPYTYYNGEKYFLRNLNTEGQGLESGGNQYSNFLLNCPLGISFKYALRRDLVISFDLSYNFTNTDYLDDVSGLYYDKEEIRSNYGNVAAELSDRRSYNEYGYRGNPNKKRDRYFLFLVGFDYVIKKDKRGLPKF